MDYGFEKSSLKNSVHSRECFRVCWSFGSPGWFCYPENKDLTEQINSFNFDGKSKNSDSHI